MEIDEIITSSALGMDPDENFTRTNDVTIKLMLAYSSPLRKASGCPTNSYP